MLPRDFDFLLQSVCFMHGGPSFTHHSPFLSVCFFSFTFCFSLIVQCLLSFCFCVLFSRLWALFQLVFIYNIILYSTSFFVNLIDIFIFPVFSSFVIHFYSSFWFILLCLLFSLLWSVIAALSFMFLSGFLTVCNTTGSGALQFYEWFLTNTKAFIGASWFFHHLCGLSVLIPSHLTSRGPCSREPTVAGVGQ